MATLASHLKPPWSHFSLLGEDNFCGIVKDHTFKIWKNIGYKDARRLVPVIEGKVFPAQDGCIIRYTDRLYAILIFHLTIWTLIMVYSNIFIGFLSLFILGFFSMDSYYEARIAKEFLYDTLQAKNKDASDET